MLFNFYHYLSQLYSSIFSLKLSGKVCVVFLNIGLASQILVSKFIRCLIFSRYTSSLAQSLEKSHGTLSQRQHHQPNLHHQRFIEYELPKYKMQYKLCVEIFIIYKHLQVTCTNNFRPFLLLSMHQLLLNLVSFLFSMTAFSHFLLNHRSNNTY